MLNKTYGFFEQGVSVLRFGKNTCFRCKDSFRSVDLEFDHNEAQSLGGKHKNLVPLCKNCNNRKNNKPFTEFYSKPELDYLESKFQLTFKDEEVFRALADLLNDEIEYAKKARLEISVAGRRLQTSKFLQPYL